MTSSLYWADTLPMLVGCQIIDMDIPDRPSTIIGGSFGWNEFHIITAAYWTFGGVVRHFSVTSPFKNVIWVSAPSLCLSAVILLPEYSA